MNKSIVAAITAALGQNVLKWR